ncbi:MAG: glycosyltransferase [Phycisphaerae bacterium]
MTISPRLSVIVTTYNRSQHLQRCIASLEMQTVVPDEIVIADDGSSLEHVKVINEIISSSRLKIIHVRQEHLGFRASANRNNGVRYCSGDCFIFLDGDIVLFPDAIWQHLQAVRPGYWVTGNAIRLTADETENITTEFIRSRQFDKLWSQLNPQWIERMNRESRNFRKRAILARIWPSESRMRRQLFASMNCSLYRSAYETINGFDEQFTGWGWEDRDLALRLQLAGFRGRTVVDSARAIHLYHQPEMPGPHAGKSAAANREYYLRKRKGVYRCEKGLRQ